MSPQRLILLIAIVVFSNTQVKSQIKETSSKFKDVRKIEVVGYSTVSLEPNEIYISFTIKEYNENGKIITIQEQDKKLKSALKKIGYSENDLKVTNILGFKTFSLNGENEDYQKTRAYLLKLKGITCIDRYLSEIDMKYLNDFTIEAFDHDDINDEVRKLQIDAFKRGKDKAQALLSIYGEECGEVLDIQEVHRYITYPKTKNQTANLHHVVTMSGGSSYQRLPTLDLLDIKVEYQVKLVFEIISKEK